MNKQQEALKQALEWYDSGKEDRQEFETLMRRLLVEQPAQQQEPVAWGNEPWMSGYGVRVGRDTADCIDLIFTKVYGQEFQLYANEAAYLRDLLNKADIPDYTSPPASKPEQQEPVAWISESENLLSWDKFYDHMTPLYTSPPASKPWVGLTEQERNDLEDYCEMIIGKAAFEAIEAKLREKNA